jgi:hypothetical protein
LKCRRGRQRLSMTVVNDPQVALIQTQSNKAMKP